MNFSGRWFVKTGCLPSVFKCWEHKPYLIPKSQKKTKLNKIQLQSSETSCKRQQSDQNYTECTPEPAKVCIESYCDEAAGEDLDETEAEKSERLKAEILSPREQIKIANTKIQQLEQTVQEMEFCVENFEDKDICFYTGFPNREVYKAVLTYLNAGPNGENLVYTRNDSRPDIESTPLQNWTTQKTDSYKSILSIPLQGEGWAF